MPSSRNNIFVFVTVSVVVIFMWTTFSFNSGSFSNVDSGEDTSKEVSSLFFQLKEPEVNENRSPDLQKQDHDKVQLTNAVFEYNVASRLQESEANWVRSKLRRNQFVDKVHLTNGVDLPHLQILWDFFYPSYDCPFTKERIGRVGDGGKWICGVTLLTTKPDCTVFSFGVSGDTSFEEEFLNRTQNCVVHMFDPTIGNAPPLVEKFPQRAFFHLLGIGSTDAGNYNTLKTIMKDLKVNDLDVLKMDVESAEWDAMTGIIKDFPERLPFAQLQIEIHLGKFKESDWLEKVSSWWNQLESAGLRSFIEEPNLLNTNQYIIYREFAFLNTKMEPFKLS